MDDRELVTRASKREGVLARWTIAFLCGYIALDAFSAVSLANDLAFRHSLVPEPALPSADTAALNLGSTVLTVSVPLLLIGTPVLYLMWFYRAYANLRLVGSGHTTKRARGATIDWFIPIVNLVRIPQHMAVLLRKSESYNSTEGEDASPLVVWWWCLGVSSYIVDRIGDRLLDATTVSGGQDLATQLLIAAAIGNLIAGILALVLVSRIHRHQQEFPRLTRPASPRLPSEQAPQHSKPGGAAGGDVPPGPQSINDRGAEPSWNPRLTRRQAVVACCIAGWAGAVAMMVIGDYQLSHRPPSVADAVLYAAIAVIFGPLVLLGASWKSRSLRRLLFHKDPEDN